jgi:DNA-binding MarR family transcriptional regulator
MEYYSPSNKDMGLWWSIRRTHEAIHKIRKIELRKYRISTIESAVILIVRQSRNLVTPIEIARQLLKDAHSISQLLIRMEKRGLLKRVRNLPRKNMIRVVLTPKGQDLYKHIGEAKSISKIMSALTPDERQQFDLALEKLRSKAMKISK